MENNNMKNGTIMILGPDKDGIGRKAFDLKITNTFPIIATDKGRTMLITPNAEVNVDDYQHLSIPPDLNIHLTNNSNDKKYIFFETNFLSDNKILNKDFIHCFTWCSRAISEYKEPRGKWFQAQIIGLPRDKAFSQNTGLFIDFFIHRQPINNKIISQIPYIKDSMRYVGDNHGNVTGPYEFSGIIRGKNFEIPNLYYSIRFGYNETINDISELHIPFKIKE